MRALRVASPVLIILCCLSFSPAVSLSLAQVHLWIGAGAERCTHQAVDVTPSTSVSRAIVGAVPSSCSGKPFRLVLFDARGQSLARATGLLDESSTVAELAEPYAPSSVKGAALLIDTRSVVANWVARDLITGSPGVEVSTTWQYYSPTSFCVEVQVSTASTVPVPWQATLDLRQRPFNGGHADTADYDMSNARPVEPGEIHDARMVIEGLEWNRTVRAGEVRTVHVCDPDAPAPDVDDAAFEVRPGAPTGTAYYACQSFAITGIARDDLYYGWEFVADLRSLKELIRAGGNEPTTERWSPDAAVDVKPVGADRSRVRGTSFMSGVKRGQTFVLEACVGGEAR